MPITTKLPGLNLIIHLTRSSQNATRTIRADAIYTVQLSRLDATHDLIPLEQKLMDAQQADNLLSVQLTIESDTVNTIDLICLAFHSHKWMAHQQTLPDKEVHQSQNLKTPLSFLLSPTQTQTPTINLQANVFSIFCAVHSM